MRTESKAIELFCMADVGEVFYVYDIKICA